MKTEDVPVTPVPESGPALEDRAGRAGPSPFNLIVQPKTSVHVHSGGHPTNNIFVQQVIYEQDKTQPTANGGDSLCIADTPLSHFQTHFRPLDYFSNLTLYLLFS